MWKSKIIPKVFLPGLSGAVSFTWSGLFCLILTSCGDLSGSNDEADGGATIPPSEGLVGGPCFPNGTCFQGLNCVAGRCIDPTAAPGLTSTWLMIDGLPVDWATSTVILKTTDADGVSEVTEVSVRGMTVVELPVTGTSTVQAFAADPGAEDAGAGYYAMGENVQPGQTRVITGWSYRDRADATAGVRGMPLGDEPSPDTLLSGLVTFNGQPVAGAVVVSSQYCGNTQCAGFTDGQGLFSFSTVPGIQRVQANLNAFASEPVEVNVVGSATDSGELTLVESDLPLPSLRVQAVDGETGAVLTNVIARDLTGIPVAEADVNGTLLVPSSLNTLYLRAPGYSVSPALHRRRLVEAATAENQTVQIELHAYPEACTRLAGDWSSTGWQSVEDWYDFEGDDAETTWLPVPASEQMHIFVDPDDFGWVDVDLGAPFVSGRGGYWLRCAPRGMLQKSVYLAFRPVNFLQQGPDVPLSFPMVGDTPASPIYIGPLLRLPHIHVADLVSDEYWYGSGHPHMGRWLYGTLPQDSPAECDGIPELHEGSYTIQGADAAEELTALRCVRHIEGSLIIGPGEYQSEVFAASLLESVGGDLSITPPTGVSVIEFRVLQSVGGTISVNQTSTLEQIQWPVLREAGAIELFDNIGLRALDFPSLQTVTEALSVSGLALQSLYLPVLRSVGWFSVKRSSITSVGLPELTSAGHNDAYTSLVIQENEALLSIGFPKLDSLGNGMFIDGTGPGATADFALLRSVEGDLVISTGSFVDALRFPRLERVAGDLQFGPRYSNRTLSLPILDFPRLVEVEGRLDILRVASLTELNVPLLRTLGRALEIKENPTLIAVDMPELLTIDQPGSASLSTSIRENQTLVRILFPSLHRAAGLAIVDNPALTQLEAGALSSCGDVVVTYNRQLCESEAFSVYDQCGENRPVASENRNGC